MSAGRSLRVLFVMPNPGYLRIYGSTVRLLADRGHEVLLSYDSPEQLREQNQLPVERLVNVTIVPPFPARQDRWYSLARGLRLLGDYVRYLDPRFADAPEARRRMEKFLPRRFGFLTRVRGLSRRQTGLILRVLRAAERATPSDPEIEKRISAVRADALVVTPLVSRGKGGVRQTDVVKSARALGLPVGAAVTSWDHLSSKGLLRGDPDRVFVWNAAQRGEAIELHSIPPEIIRVTGAQLFDQWFSRAPSVAADEFRRSAGLPADRPYLLFVGSSPNIAPGDSEVRFFRRWVSALRDAEDSDLSRAAVLVRPHPGNHGQWQEADLTGLDGVSVSPSARPSLPMNEEDESHYFHSLYFSRAVVGINTSAMIEAAAVGKAVFTVRADEMQATQEGTLHFRLLLAEDAPSIRFAEDLDEHVSQLGQALAEPDVLRAEVDAFARAFVRPQGLELASTPILVDEIERLADVDSHPARLRAALIPARALLLTLTLMSTKPRRRRAKASGPEFTYARPRIELYRMLFRRRWNVVKGVARSIVSPQVRDQEAVSDIYEAHYSSDNADYARSRDRRRDLFTVRGRPIYADGWFTMRFHLNLLLESLGALEAGSVLEVGSGRGTNLALLAMRRPDLGLTGIELTEAGVKQARELVLAPSVQHIRAAGQDLLSDDATAALSRVAFVQGSALEMPFEDKSFDVSFTCLVLEQVPELYPQILAEMRRVTRGHCIFIEPFGDANGIMGRAYLRSLDYFRAGHRSFADHGLEPIRFTTDIPQKAHFKTGLLVARVR